MKTQQYKFIAPTITKHCKINLHHTVKVRFVYICIFSLFFAVGNDL